MYISKFGTYTLPDQYEMNESGGGARRPSTQSLGGAGGGWDNIGLGPDPLDEDEISKSFIIKSDTSANLQTAIDNFIGNMLGSQKDWKHGARLLIATLPDATTRVTWAKCIEARVTWEYFNVNEAWAPVQVTWRRTWPVWEKGASVLYLGSDLATFADTASLTLGSNLNVTSQSLSSSSSSFTITNGGTARIFNGIIEFAGAINTPIMTNTANGFTFTIGENLAAGDRFTIRPASFDARKNGGQSWASMTLGSAEGQLAPMVLEPGANPITITCTGTPSATFKYYWANSYY